MYIYAARASAKRGVKEARFTTFATSSRAQEETTLMVKGANLRRVHQQEKKNASCIMECIYFCPRHIQIYFSKNLIEKKFFKWNVANKLKCAKIDKYHQSSTRSDALSTEQWRIHTFKKSFLIYTLCTPFTLFISYLLLKACELFIN